MGIKVALEHRTTYTFDRRVTLGPHTVRLRPAAHSRTPIEAYSLRVTPENHFVNWQQDPFGNHLARLVFPEATDRLEIVVGLVADLQVVNPFDFFVEEYAEQVPFAYDPLLATDLEPYLRLLEEVARPARAGAAGQARRPRRTRRGRRTRRRQQRRPRRGRLLDPHGARRDDSGGDAGPRHRVVPRLGLAHGQRAAAAGAGGPLRLRLPRPARPRPAVARRAQRTDRGLHRPARLGRGVRARRRLDRSRPDLRAVRGRGPHPPLGHPAPGLGRAHQRCRRPLRGHAGLRQRRHPLPRGPARHEALHRRAVGPHRRRRRARRHPARRRRSRADDGRRADLRLGRRHGERAVEHRRRR